jgi:hypothetical protein
MLPLQNKKSSASSFIKFGFYLVLWIYNAFEIIIRVNIGCNSHIVFIKLPERNNSLIANDSINNKITYVVIRNMTPLSYTRIW